MGNATDKVAQVGRNSTTHHDCDLLDNTNTGVVGLPKLFTMANSLEEGEECRDTKCRGDDREGVSRSIVNILISMVNIQHRWEKSHPTLQTGTT